MRMTPFLCVSGRKPRYFVAFTHNSTHVGSEGDAFAGFVLGATAAAPQGVPPDDACRGGDNTLSHHVVNNDPFPERNNCGHPSSPWSGRMSSRCRLFLRDGGKPLPLDRRRCRLDSMAAGETMPAGGTFPILS